MLYLHPDDTKKVLNYWQKQLSNKGYAVKIEGNEEDSNPLLRLEITHPRTRRIAVIQTDVCPSGKVTKKGRHGWKIYTIRSGEPALTIPRRLNLDIPLREKRTIFYQRAWRKLLVELQNNL